MFFFSPAAVLSFFDRLTRFTIRQTCISAKGCEQAGKCYSVWTNYALSGMKAFLSFLPWRA